MHLFFWYVGRTFVLITQVHLQLRIFFFPFWLFIVYHLLFSPDTFNKSILYVLDLYFLSLKLSSYIPSCFLFKLWKNYSRWDFKSPVEFSEATVMQLHLFFFFWFLNFTKYIFKFQKDFLVLWWFLGIAAFSFVDVIVFETKIHESCLKNNLSYFFIFLFFLKSFYLYSS